MNPMKRVGVAVFLMALGALFTASPALAREYTQRYALVPPAIDPPEPKASGKWALTHFDVQIKAKRVEVTCKGLTPGEEYLVVVWVSSSDEWGGGDSWEALFACTAGANGKLEFDHLFEYGYGRSLSVHDLWIEKLNGYPGVVVLETQR